MSRLHVVRVFCGPDGSGGNPLAVFLDGFEVPGEARQRVAADLGFSETVFVDDAERGEIRIFTPAVELGFAGHPTVGTAWLLAEERAPVQTLRPPAGDVPVDALEGPPAGMDMYGGWAWIDEAAGVLRARVFPRALGIAEDEATGAAAVQLGQRIGRPIDIRQGRGSRILARPLDGGWVEIGGSTVLDEVREYVSP
jgi:predicted PhzF superfamily epimerase YddE/YHI9